MVGFLDNLIEGAQDLAEDAALKLDPSGTVSTFLNGLVEKSPELADITAIITADTDLTAAIANLRLQNPETLDKIMANFTGGEDASPEALEAAEALLSNDVLRGQLTEVINNVANDPNITDEHVTELLEASEAYKNTVEEMGLTGVFGVAVLGTENPQLTAATQRLTEAYVDLGMDEADAKAAISEGWKIGINEKIDGLDNFGSMLSGGINGLMFNLGPLLDAIGLGPILRQMGIDTNFGITDILGQETADRIQSTVTPYTDWMEDNLNLNIVDGIEAANINALPEFIEKNITSAVGVFEADAPATTGNVVDFPSKFNTATAGVTVMTPEQVREAIVQVDPQLADEMAGIQSNADLKAQFDKFGSMTKEDAQREAAELQEKLANPEVTVREAVAGIGTPGM